MKVAAALAFAMGLGLSAGRAGVDLPDAEAKLLQEAAAETNRRFGKP